MALEQVLFVHKELDVYKIPPRTGAGGWRSGEWRVNDRIFTGRCRVVAKGEALEVRLEDPQTGELFGVAPVPPGQAHIAVEQASDSSRNFVLRLVDAASGRHAFVGLSFSERSTAFDFNVAISDHERQQRRAAEMARIQGSADPLAAAAELMPEAAALYRPAGDLSLKEGETIKISVKKKEHGGEEHDSFLSRMGHAAAAAPGGAAKLAPPPGQPAVALPPPPMPAGAAPTPAPVPFQQQQQQQSQQPADLLGFDAFNSFPAAALSGGTAAAAPAPANEGWATFD